MEKRCLVLGAGGFIGNHLVSKLVAEGHWVRGVDLEHPEFDASHANEFVIGDLRDQAFCDTVLDQPFTEVYQLAADMGGAGYLFQGDHDADVMHGSALINLNIVERAHRRKVGKVFYSSSACIYPRYNQEDPDNPNCAEQSAYPADPDSEYGWEKLFSERLYLSFSRNHGLPVRIARFHNIFGAGNKWTGGKEKAPAAIMRKVCKAAQGGDVEVWGDGKQTRSFLYIDECLEGVARLMDSDCTDPVNIGSDEIISLNDFALMVAAVAGKQINLRHTPGPEGVRGRNSDNRLVDEVLNWKPSQPLAIGVEKTFAWISLQINEHEVQDRSNTPDYCS